jgi:hypothetical protein
VGLVRVRPAEGVLAPRPQGRGRPWLSADAGPFHQETKLPSGADFRTYAPQQRAFFARSPRRKKVRVQSFGHDFSVRPSGNFVFESAQASYTRPSLKFFASLKSAPRR